MIRITEKNGEHYELKPNKKVYGWENGIRLVQIIGEFEDLFEKYNIENIKKLEDLFKSQEKVLKIIFEKYVDIDYLKESDNAKEYNSKITIIINGVKYAKSRAIKLTQREFELLKRWQS